LFHGSGEAVARGDQLTVTGATRLGGVLLASFADVGAIKVNDSFQLVSSTGQLTGKFKRVLAPLLRPGLEWSMSYTDHAAFLKVIDDVDLVSRWSAATTDSADGDWDLDDDSDGEDFLAWQRAF